MSLPFPTQTNFLSFHNVSGAVDDLVNGYESLVQSIPSLAQKVASMSQGTENMAKHLEERMRNLVDGYEYLDAVSSQIPESFRQIASTHRQALLDSVHINAPNEKEYEDTLFDAQISKLRAELNGISHERVVVDILTRQTISRAKSHYTKAGTGGEPVLKHHFSSSSSSLSQIGGRAGMGAQAIAASSSGGRGLTSSSVEILRTTMPAEHSTKATVAAAAREPSRDYAATTTAATVPSSSSRRPTGAASAASVHRVFVPSPTLSTAYDAITVPEYQNPILSKTQEPIASSAASASSSHSSASALGQVKPKARAVGTGLMVPSMRQGSLPPELLQIKTSPQDTPTPVDLEAQQEASQRAQRFIY